MKKITILIMALFCVIATLKAQTFNATVAKDGSGTHTTVAAAIASAPTNSTSTYFIRIKPGLYNEKDTVPANRPNITMIGDDVLTTVVYFNDNANTQFNGGNIGTLGSSAFFVNGANFTASNITFQNNSGVSAGQAVAVSVNGDKASFRNCRFLGFQDVLYVRNAGTNSYFNNCYIEGTVDFIFGASTSFFENCYIYCKNRQSGGVITAPNTPTGTSFGSPWGLVFNNCKINGANTMTGAYFLGRPWQNKPQAVFLNTSMSDVINAAGWSSSSAGSATAADVSFGEYNNSGAGWNNGSRSFSNATILNATQAANYVVDTVLKGWTPCTSTVNSMCNAPDFPVATANFLGTQNNISSASISWNMCWPLAITYVVKRSVNGGAWSTISTTNGTANNFNYSITDNNLQAGVNRYILEMNFNSVTSTSTDTIVISNQPTISSNVLSLPAFNATTNTASSSQNFSVSGNNLTNNIIVTAPANFQVSSNNSTWGNSVTLTQSGGVLASTPVYVRLAAVANGTYNGNVVLSTTGGTSLNVSVSGTTTSAPTYVATVLQEFPFSANANDNSATRAIGINSTTATLRNLTVSDGTTVTSVPAYSSAIGLGFAPSLTATSTGLWTTANGGPGSSLTRLHCVQFTVSGNTGFAVRVDSILFTSAIWNSSNGRLAIVYSKSNFVSDSANVTSGGTLNGTALSGTAFGAFANPIVPPNSTAVGGSTAIYRIPLNGSTGVSLASGETITIRLYYAVGSSSTGRYGQLKNVQFKGSVTPPPPTISSFAPTSQVSGGSVVITGTNFSGVSSVSFGGTPATSYVVNSGTQITAVVGAGTTGSVSVTTTSGTESLSGFTLLVPTTYYNAANSDVTDVNNWGTNTDGTGSKPSNFTNDLQTFRIFNNGATMSQVWTVSGTNSKISVNSNSGVFNVTQTISGIVDVENDAELQVKTATAPTFGILGNGSTVGYSGTINQTITAANYSNLSLNGSGIRTFPNSVVGIAGAFTANSYTIANTGSIISFNGTNPQTIPPFTFDSLIINNNASCITQGGGSSVVVNKGCNILQNLTVDAGDIWVMAGNNGIAFTVANGRTLTVNGTLDNQSLGTATWGSLASNSSSATVATSSDSARFVVNSNGVYKINAAVTNSYFIGAGNYNPGSTIQILNGSPRIPAFVGGNVVYATAAVGTGSFVQQASNTIAGNFTLSSGIINNGTGGTARAVTVLGNLNISGGEYDINGNVSGTSSAQVLNVYGSVNVSGTGKLYPTISTNAGSGTINAYGNISVTGGNFANALGNLVGNTLNLLGSTPKTCSGLSTNALSLTINNSAGVTFTGDANTANITTTSGNVNMLTNTLTVSGTFNRTTGWIIGKLNRTITSGTNISQTFDIGDSNSYLPVTITFAGVSNAGSVTLSVNSPITNVPSYATSVVSPSDYVNRYWTMSNTNVIFTNYSATFRYLANDLIGNATSNSVFAYLHNGTSWIPQTVSGGLNANTISNITTIGNIMFGNDCTPTTPTVTISTNNTTVCSNSLVTFNALGTNTGTSPVYQWRRNGSNLTTGNSITFAPNTLSNNDIITCELTSNKPCVTSTTALSNSITMVVNQSPAIVTIYNGATNAVIPSNTIVYCTIGSQQPYYVDPNVRYGTWTSSNASIITLNNGSSVSGLSSSGIINTIANGTATIKYTLPSTIQGNPCTSETSINVIVAKQETPDNITGQTSVCVGDVKNYTTTSNGGVWAINGRGTISPLGDATYTSAGTSSIVYTITNINGCKASNSLPITINANPAMPNISFAPGNTVNPFLGAPSGNWCRNRVFNLAGSPANGVWGASGVVSVTPNGIPSTTTSVNTGSIAGSGSISYQVTNGAGCRSTRTINFGVFACATRGMTTEKLSTNNFVIFPNPAKEVINVKFDKLTSGSIFVTDLFGKQLSSQFISFGNNSIDVSKFAKGVYFVNIVTENGREVKKVVVE